MTRFSENAIFFLKLLGWHEGRCRNASADIEALTDEGYSVFPCVVSFLKEFGGLHIPYFRLLTGGYKADSILKLDIPEAISETYPDNVERDATEIGTPLCLIGTADDWFTTVVMDEKGTVYELSDGIYLAGQSGDDALETFLNAKPRPFAT